MAFQDFDEITSRRRASNELKFRRRVMIAAVSGVAFLGLVAAAVFGLVTHLGVNGGNSPAAATAVPQAPVEVSKTTRLVKYVCNATDYKGKCEKALSHAVDSGSPKEFLVAAISAAKEELHRAFNKTSAFTFHTPAERVAIRDCERLMDDALDELEASISTVGDASLATVSSKAPELNSWLSAVITYQQTCIDGFPEGKRKNRMQRLFKASKEFTSNSLALVTEVSALLSAFQVTGAAERRLLQVPPLTTPLPGAIPVPVVVPGAAAELASGSIPVKIVPPSLPPVGGPLLPLPAPVVPSALELDNFRLPAWMEEDDRRSATVKDDRPAPNVTVAKDGSGQFNSINAALAAMPPKYEGRYVIYIKEGVYEETVIVTKKMVNVTMYGDGSQKTIITAGKNFVDGVRTFLTATFVASGDGFLGRHMGFKNTAGPDKHQAVAARIQSDRAILINCRFEGYQDTLYAQAHRQFYRSCVISGTVDFIFGDAAAVFQNCLIVVRRPLENQQNIVTAQGRTDKKQTTGIVLHNCHIVASRNLEPVKDRIRSYLGRPWKQFSRTIIMESMIDDFIHPDGWLPWAGSFALDTLYYAEYNNKGPGAALDARVNWPGYKKAIPKAEAEQYTVESFLQGDWICNVTGVPVRFTLYES